jgi:hypothetical protein
MLEVGLFSGRLFACKRFIAPLIPDILPYFSEVVLRNTPQTILGKKMYWLLHRMTNKKVENYFDDFAARMHFIY